MTHKNLLTLLFAVVALTVAGCSSDGNAAKEPNKPAKSAAPAKKTVTIALSSNDQMQYDKKELSVEANTKVKLTLTHTGKMPKTSMGHNFVLLKAGTSVEEFAKKASAAKATDHIPQDAKDSIIAHTNLIGGGESATVTFDAPAPGTYTYICTFPGHYALMKGVLTVK